MIGKTLGHYTILKPLGKGGMGEVFLAEDTRLKREVAIKVLPESLRSDSERLARFRREAEAAARLKHPNIATIHTLEEAVPSETADNDNQRQPVGANLVFAQPTNQTPQNVPILFIVMEYVEGVSLSDIIPSDGMDVGGGSSAEGRTQGSPLHFFDVFIPLADALSHAHEHGRIHRDLKPGNIMITGDGTPKILDFGLARIIGPNPAVQTIGEDDSTLTMKADASPDAGKALKDQSDLSRGGVLMGTPNYMSPEQADRRETDHRTDIFSLGVVMYEALTGRKPFEGDSITSLISRIMEAQPEPATALKPITPHQLWWTVRKCLEKNREERTQTARELHRELQLVQEEVENGTLLVDASNNPSIQQSVNLSIPLRPITGTAIALLLVTLTATLAWLLKPVPEPPLRKFQIPWDIRSNSTFDISPDGMMLAYTENGGVWIRDLVKGGVRSLVGTDAKSYHVFWSPQNDYVGYIDQSDDTPALKKVSVNGGDGITVCTLSEAAGFSFGFRKTGFLSASWSENGVIAFSLEGSLYTVSEEGGAAQLLAAPDSTKDEFAFANPRYLPGDRGLLYITWKHGDQDAANRIADQVDLVFLSQFVRNARLAASEIMVLTEKGATTVRTFNEEWITKVLYAPSAQLVYNSRMIKGNTRAIQFSMSSLETTGEPYLVSPHSVPMGVSRDNTLILGSMEYEDQQQLVWMDRRGTILDTIGQPQFSMFDPVLSPDRRYVAVIGLESADNRDIWLHDTVRGNKVPLSTGMTILDATAWSPSGNRIAFSATQNGSLDLFVLDIEASDTPRLLVGDSLEIREPEWSPDGRTIGYNVVSQDSRDLWYVPLSAAGIPGAPVRFTNAPGIESMMQFSPDGRYVVYQSDASGRWEVYVAPFPRGGRGEQVSVDGGKQPRWRGDEIYFLDLEDNLMSVRAQTRPVFRVSQPERLFKLSNTAPAGIDYGVHQHPYDVTPDGQRIVAVQVVGNQQATLSIVQNWIREFEEGK